MATTELNSEKAKEIITEKEQVLVSQRDSELFFDAITNPAKPNQKLAEVADEYKKLVSKYFNNPKF